jgi:hypothetical protein
VLEAAAAGVAVDSLAVYGVPLMVDEEASQRWREYVERLDEVLAEGRRGDAIELFMRLAGASDDGIARARESSVGPAWSALPTHSPTMRPACGTATRPPPATQA